MGDCYIVRRGGAGQAASMPVLNTSYPQDVTVTAGAGVSATFSVLITQPGVPAEYVYTWYKDNSVIAGANGPSVTITGLTAAATHTIYCTVANSAGTVTSRSASLTVKDWLPTYTYTGTANLVDDGDYCWRLKLLSSGTLTFTSLGNAASTGIDAFVVGGGGGGGTNTGNGNGSGGGGGGYTLTQSAIQAAINTAYTITIGAGGSSDNTGGQSSAFTYSANGGAGGGNKASGNGGSGGGGYGINDNAAGNGGSDGSNGEAGINGGAGGTGQGTTTREFGETDGALYAGGGGGTSRYGTVAGTGGAGGGGNGANISGYNASSTGNAGVENTGGGGGGGNNKNSSDSGSYGGAGGSGIVIIRNHREVSA